MRAASADSKKEPLFMSLSLARRNGLVEDTKRGVRQHTLLHVSFDEFSYDSGPTTAMQEADAQLSILANKRDKAIS